MKIGIITFHDTTNFGSLLQTYGLYKKIVNLGYDCEVIDYQCESLRRREIPKKLKFSFIVKEFVKDLLIGRHRRKKYRKLSSFLHSKMHLSPHYTRETIKECVEIYDKIIVGSDIVWGMDIIEGDLSYFLDFVAIKDKRFAFASSVGTPWTDKEKNLLAPLLKNFSRICVREDESADWVEELTDARPDIVCDPTMLLDSTEWLTLVRKKQLQRDYVLVYFDNKNGDCYRNAIRYTKAHDLDVWVINDYFSTKEVRNVKPHSLSDFLSLIYNASKVITASYHGLLFSIYFNKQFVYYNRAHKSRMQTLARRLNVEQACGDGRDIMSLPILDYQNINPKVDEYRNYSTNCLKAILEK